MQRLLPWLRDLVGDAAAVHVDEYWSSPADDRVDRSLMPSVHTVLVQPYRFGSLSFAIVFEQCISVQLGAIGGKWELGHERGGIEHAMRLVEAAVDGRVSETSAFGRSSVEVTFEDGSTERETGYQGCRKTLVVLPGWTKWGRTVRYEPYSSHPRGPRTAASV